MNDYIPGVTEYRMHEPKWQLPWKWWAARRQKRKALEFIHFLTNNRP